MPGLRAACQGLGALAQRFILPFLVHRMGRGAMGVRGIPALFLFKDGQVVSNKVGAAPKAALENWIKTAI